jgi:hypothetical protein
MIEHVAGREERDRGCARGLREAMQAQRVARQPSRRKGEIGARAEDPRMRLEMRGEGVVRRLGQQDGDEALGVGQDIRPVQDA